MTTKKNPIESEPVESAAAEVVVAEPLPGQPLPVVDAVVPDPDEFIEDLRAAKEDEDDLHDYLDFLARLDADERASEREWSPSPFESGYETLDDVFYYADILFCGWNADDSTMELRVRVRRTGQELTFTGDATDELVYQAVDRLAGDDFVVREILSEYNLTETELHDLVAPPVAPLFDPVVVSAAQPLYFLDHDGKVYLGAYLDKPINEVDPE